MLLDIYILTTTKKLVMYVRFLSTSWKLALLCRAKQQFRNFLNFLEVVVQNQNIKCYFKISTKNHVNSLENRFRI